ncbi:MAG: hypothetical protein WBN04_08445, partial [Paracoccaceae bacterium]
ARCLPSARSAPFDPATPICARCNCLKIARLRRKRFLGLPSARIFFERRIRFRFGLSIAAGGIFFDYDNGDAEGVSI